ncbi:MAG: hypothetical protein EHM91_00090 [Planctomycetota bacterium]|nr:MAG: hypothetical protein EHM91_00090 [Planctomycetota bacterium]
MEGDGPAVGQRVRILMGARLLFSGSVQTVDESYESRPDHVAWQITAIDDTGEANARRPFGTFLEVSATTIAQYIIGTFAPAFAAGVEAGLPPVSIVFDGSDTFIACLARLASAVGGYCKIEDHTVYLFTAAAADPPAPIDPDHRFLSRPPIQMNTDSSQLRTRVYGKGYGETIQSDLVAGETLVPIEDGGLFSPLGGRAIAARTADGGQSEPLTYTGLVRRGGGSLVGPGAAPANAPTLGLAQGGVVTSGFHQVAVVHVTAAGKSLAGPREGIDVNPIPPPTVGPIAGAPLTGTGPDQGFHSYVVTFLILGGETTAGPWNNAVETSAALGQIAAPGQPSPAALLVDGVLTAARYDYKYTYVNANGETEGGYQAPAFKPAVPAMGVVGDRSSTTGGAMTPDWYYNYFLSFVTASGYETAIEERSHYLGAGYNAINVWIPTSPDARVVKRRLWRTGGLFQPTSTDYGKGYLVTEIMGNSSSVQFKDTTANLSANEVYFKPGHGTPSGPRGTPPGYQVQVSGISPGPAGVTARRIYRSTDNSSAFHLLATLSNNTTTTYQDNIANNDANADMPTSNTTGTAVQRIPVSAIPLGPAGTTGRKLYRRFYSEAPRLVTTIANNTSTTFTDTVPNANLGANPPSTNTAIGNQIALTKIPTGASQVVAREIYMTKVTGPGNMQPLQRVLTIPDNTTVEATLNIADAAITGPTEPLEDTSGLAQPQGQVNPGSPTLIVASPAPFAPTGGWVITGGGQVVRYTSIVNNLLSGIPVSGPGAIVTAVLFGQQATPAPALTGVTGIATPIQRGAAVHLWVQRDDLQAQAEHAARTGGDGVVEFLIVDERQSYKSLPARCDSDLALFSRPLVTVRYATRDLKTKSGKTITVDLPPPLSMRATLIIQEVTITEIDLVSGLPPRFTVTASSVRFSLEDTLRRLIAGGQIVGGSS